MGGDTGMNLQSSTLKFMRGEPLHIQQRKTRHHEAWKERDIGARRASQQPKHLPLVDDRDRALLATTVADRDQIGYMKPTRAPSAPQPPSPTCWSKNCGGWAIAGRIRCRAVPNTLGVTNAHASRASSPRRPELMALRNAKNLTPARG